MVMMNTRRPVRLEMLSTDVERVVRHVMVQHDSLDVLCNNMGVMARVVLLS
jgi:short-subunit dehydrogenase involved in D-alanine esterification of teichoic acids